LLRDDDEAKEEEEEEEEVEEVEANVCGRVTAEDDEEGIASSLP
jgi:hypothetical protein